MSKYMIDTSIWIDYFAERNPELNDKIDDLLDENKIYINGIIISEILHGVKTENNYLDLKNYLDGLNYVETDKALFDKVGYYGFVMKKNGLTIPLSDLIIATQCVENSLTLFEKDKHYVMFGKLFDLKRFLL